ncbi:MAG: TIR domain-containing protein [Tidjanibacter sp.]|nr:TIR domain-containing protein [Tidjanibacter sp.]
MSNRYDIFISYRREDAAELARNIQLQLEKYGYKVFLDVERLKDGHFDKKIIDAIKSAKVFLALLTPKYLGRCGDSDDWVRKEIECAVENKVTIVPVNINRDFTSFPEDCPEHIVDVIHRHQYTDIITGSLFSSTMDTLYRERLRIYAKPKRNNKGLVIALLVAVVVASGTWAAFMLISNIRMGNSLKNISWNVRPDATQDESANQQISPESEGRQPIEELDIDNKTKVREQAVRDSIKRAKAKAREQAVRDSIKMAKAKADSIARAEKAKADSIARAEEKAAQERQERLDRMVRQGGGSNGVYEVGYYYDRDGKQGVVFEVSADGRHGKIVSLTQSGSQMNWCAYKGDQKRSVGTESRTDGAANQAVVSAVRGWQEKFPAFAWCAEQGDGWYLPAIEELEKFATNAKVNSAVNNTLSREGGTPLFGLGDSGWYWSSTEADKNCVWFVRMNYGDSGSGTKDYTYHVRAVATF